jgi:hypothetical protein
VTRAVGGLLVGFLACVVACFSPLGAYREMQSDRRPSRDELIGTWRVTAETAKAAAATGLSLADVQAGFIVLRPDGTCRADLYASPCGHFPSERRQPTESCAWDLEGVGSASVRLTFGQRPKSFVFGLHHLRSDPPVLWQYICDPDSAEYLELQRATS